MVASGRRHGAEIEMWRQLTQLTGLLSSSLDKRLTRRHGVSVSEFTALSTLTEADRGGIRMQDLADAIGLNQSTVSRLIARMESSGLATREIGARDRRCTYAVITDQGRTIAEEARGTFQKEFNTALDTAAFDERTAAVVARLRHDPTTAPE
ncbi:MarR family winged helix-turn-helix transcriptional regulator [Streptomyces sp. NBC_01294]|uniref:MarR family winged helix-turn-helix transcriptional regulator n=2 Tax=unclassified Streptomyces TaxID=2593676 RepID=UPI002DDA582B|nr:MarR family transcriptional regulator [Streptomyces sp. NBC_01294]WRZ56488.1 MarR family transcriptional regulator [Streptomyces sp. NBC_01294]